MMLRNQPSEGTMPVLTACDVCGYPHSTPACANVTCPAHPRNGGSLISEHEFARLPEHDPLLEECRDDSWAVMTEQTDNPAAFRRSV